ncbi:hypothetical protein C8E87_2687 [Paractinoplanes brasiliensis]|uniref:Uncharacterized protein n=1 Tax=Paractinoplanes brasiliensis TaxID=52695 RepID=A0A4R6JWD6_9ACTN|nr:hypothetical protein C8E87_2687 [Actinoplanes brasiliensis]
MTAVGLDDVERLRRLGYTPRAKAKSDGYRMAALSSVGMSILLA